MQYLYMLIYSGIYPLMGGLIGRNSIVKKSKNISERNAKNFVYKFLTITKKSLKNRKKLTVFWLVEILWHQGPCSLKVLPRVLNAKLNVLDLKKAKKVMSDAKKYLL